MSKKKDRPTDAITEAIERDAKVQNRAVRSGDNDVDINLDEFLGLPEGEKAQPSYPSPANTASAVQEAMTPAPAAIPSLNVVSALPPRMARGNMFYDRGWVDRQSSLAASRAAAQATLETMPEGERRKYVVRVNQSTGAWYIARRPLALNNDPFVKEMGTRLAEVDAKLKALEPDLTERQVKVLLKLKNRAINYVKGKKEGLPRPQVSAKSLDRLLFRALEMQASRRKAQLGAQERSARKQRHDLVTKKRTVQLADGSTVNYNRRAAKKYATAARIKDAVGAAKVAAAQERAVIVARNKDQRVRTAISHNNKPNKRDLPYGPALPGRPQNALDLERPRFGIPEGMEGVKSM